MKGLSAKFGIDRRTVSTDLGSSRGRFRRGGLDQEQTIEAAGLYEAGWSSGRLAEKVDVSADNVPKALRGTGVAIRPRRGGPAPKRRIP